MAAAGRTSSATRTGSPTRSRCSRPAATASSSATSPGSPSDVFEILRAYGAALVYGDHPERPWQPLELTTDWTFVRFHYGHRGRRGNYSETELREWAARLREVRREAEVFAYFNNDWEAFAPRNAQRLRSLLLEGMDDDSASSCATCAPGRSSAARRTRSATRTGSPRCCSRAATA